MKWHPRNSWSNGKLFSPSKLTFASIAQLKKLRIWPPLTVFLSPSWLVWNLLLLFFSYCTTLKQQVIAPRWSPFSLRLLPHEIMLIHSYQTATVWVTPVDNFKDICGHFQSCLRGRPHGRKQSFFSPSSSSSIVLRIFASIWIHWKWPKTL